MFDKFAVERALRKIHSWLGVIILPWVILAGLTGLYLNHPSAVDWLWKGAGEPSPMSYDAMPSARPVQTIAEAFAIGEALIPGAVFDLETGTPYRGRTVYALDDGPDLIRIDAATGFVWLQQRYRTSFIAPDGTVLRRDLRWRRVLLSLHERGWVGNALGRWLADLTAAALVVFGVTGVYLFLAPRLRKWRNKRARLAAQA